MALNLSLENAALAAWVQEIVELCAPSSVHVCDGSEEERQTLVADMLAAGTLLALNPEKRPNSYLCRSDPRDVARVESRTFICSEHEVDAGPTNHWQEPGAMKARLRALFPRTSRRSAPCGRSAAVTAAMRSSVRSASRSASRP